MMATFFFPYMLAHIASRHAALLSNLVRACIQLCFVCREAQHNGAVARVTTQGSSSGLVGSCALELKPQTTHSAAP